MLIYGGLLLHDWAIEPPGPRLSGKLLSNDISEDDQRYWTNELYWGMGLQRGGVGGSGVTNCGPIGEANTIVFTLWSQILADSGW